MNPHLHYLAAKQHLDELGSEADRVRAARELRREQRRAGIGAVINWVLTGSRRNSARTVSSPPVEGIRSAAAGPLPVCSEYRRC
jgi:hypothetical protein